MNLNSPAGYDQDLSKKKKNSLDFEVFDNGESLSLFNFMGMGLFSVSLLLVISPSHLLILTLNSYFQADSAEEFEPLFDYSRVQPRSVVCIDGNGSQASIMLEFHESVNLLFLCV